LRSEFSDERVASRIRWTGFQLSNPLFKIVATANRLLEPVFRYCGMHVRDLISQPIPRGNISLRRNLDRRTKEVACFTALRAPYVADACAADQPRAQECH